MLSLSGYSKLLLILKNNDKAVSGLQDERDIKVSLQKLCNLWEAHKTKENKNGKRKFYDLDRLHHDRKSELFLFITFHLRQS
ncbi:MAG: hypothetical protein ACI9N1_001689 [Flavobacteriales bacterium]|jgi:hypothetical protein